MNVRSIVMRTRAVAVAAIVVIAAVISSAAAGAAGMSAATSLDGVYRVNWSEKELLAAGASQAYVAGNFGYLRGRQGGITMKLQRGGFRLQETLLPHFLCRGIYAASKTTISIRMTTGCFGQVIARWSLRNGRLSLDVSRATDPGDKVTFGGKPWQKIA